jgi:hypothetical protein
MGHSWCLAAGADSAVAEGHRKGCRVWWNLQLLRDLGLFFKKLGKRETRRRATSTQYFTNPSAASPTPSGRMYTASTGVGFNLATSSRYSTRVEYVSTNVKPTAESLELLPDDAQYVEVTLRIDEENQYFYRFECGGTLREAGWGEWEKKKMIREGQALECYLNTRNNGLHFWTWTLDPSVVQRYESKKVDSKHSKGKHRAH